MNGRLNLLVKTNNETSETFHFLEKEILFP